MNGIFPSKEGDGIEHVDFSYKEFKELLNKLSDTAFEEGQKSR